MFIMHVSSRHHTGSDKVKPRVPFLVRRRGVCVCLITLVEMSALCGTPQEEVMRETLGGSDACLSL